jgi:hypothetical protein
MTEQGRRSTALDGAYRCAECRHGRNLSAAAYAVAFGPLADAG